MSRTHSDARSFLAHGADVLSVPEFVRGFVGHAVTATPQSNPGIILVVRVHCLITEIIHGLVVNLDTNRAQFERSDCHQTQLPQTFENTIVRSVLKHPAH